MDSTVEVVCSLVEGAVRAAPPFGGKKPSSPFRRPTIRQLSGRPRQFSRIFADDDPLGRYILEPRGRCDLWGTPLISVVGRVCPRIRRARSPTSNLALKKLPPGAKAALCARSRVRQSRAIAAARPRFDPPIGLFGPKMFRIKRYKITVKDFFSRAKRTPSSGRY